MTTDEAIAIIPEGWRLRLTQYDQGWTAELFQARGVGQVVEQADTPAEAVRLAAEEAGRHPAPTSRQRP